MARYIDADRLLMNFKTNGSVFVYGVSVINAIISRINIQPTADVVEVKHGKWVEKPQADGLYGCSICGIMRFGESNYCPNCGAKMDKEAANGETGVDV